MQIPLQVINWIKYFSQSRQILFPHRVWGLGDNTDLCNKSQIHTYLKVWLRPAQKNKEKYKSLNNTATKIIPYHCQNLSIGSKTKHL